MSSLIHQGTPPEHETASAPENTGAHPTSVVERFRGAVQRCMDFLNSNEITRTPIHPDFVVVDEGWNWNRIKQTDRDPKLKVKFLLNASDLSLLDDCPYPCKIGPDDLHRLDYCGFAYPKNDKHMAALEQWASRFPEAAVLTYGAHGWGGRWVPGEFVKTLSGTLEG